MFSPFPLFFPIFFAFLSFLFFSFLFFLLVQLQFGIVFQNLECLQNVSEKQFWLHFRESNYRKTVISRQSVCLFVCLSIIPIFDNVEFLFLFSFISVNLWFLIYGDKKRRKKILNYTPLKDWDSFSFFFLFFFFLSFLNLIHFFGRFLPNKTIYFFTPNHFIRFFFLMLTHCFSSVLPCSKSWFEKGMTNRRQSGRNNEEGICPSVSPRFYHLYPHFNL